MKKKRVLTPDELQMVERASSIGTPLDDLAVFLGVAPSTLDRMIARDPALKEALERGRARGGQVVRTTLFNLATGYTKEVEKPYNHPLGDGQWERRIEKVKVRVEPNPFMLAFLAKTQYGFRENNRLEISGPGGGPIPLDQMKPHQRDERIEKLIAMRAKLAVAGKVTDVELEDDGVEEVELEQAEEET
jgi:hypothetical protein